MMAKPIYKTIFIAAVIFLLPSILALVGGISSPSGRSGGALLSAQGKTKFLTPPFENKVFIEEQGQFKKILEENKINFPGIILFAVNNPEFNAYFTTTGITFLFCSKVLPFQKVEPLNEEEEKKKGEAHEREPLTKWEVVNIQWLNTNPAMQVSAKEKVNNYYTYGRYEDNSQYDHVSAYKKLYYFSIYEGVDAEFELPETGGIKYQFIVHAGFNIPAIAYRMEGIKNLYLDEKGDLHIETTLGTLIDKAPIAFTKSSNSPLKRGLGGLKIPFKYTITGNRVEITTENKTLPLSEDLIIDPWIINPALPSSNIACDIQEDSVGNVFVNGGTSGSGSYQVQKYNSAGVLQWSHNYTCTYYGDIAVANSGSVYYTDGITAKLTKLSPSGALIYSISQGSENWRLSFNKSKTILAMGGYLSSSSSLTKIDTTTGAMTNTVNYPSDTWAVATDCNGEIYSLHQGTSPCILRKTNANFTPAASLVTSPGFCITGYSNVRAYASGYNAITISGPYLYIYDGLQLRRFLKSTLTFVNSVSVANGTTNNCSGIAFDFCGNIYVGTMSTIEKYDMLLNFISSIPAPNIVYDIILAGNGDILACGKSFVANFGPTCPAPPQLVSTATSTNVSCNPGTASILATGGTSPYSYTWQPGGQTTATATGLSPGTYTYIVNDAFCQTKTDSIIVLQSPVLTITSDTNNTSNTNNTSLNTFLHNPSCFGFNDGSAVITVSGGTPPYTYSWNTNPVQMNDTASGLSAGGYTVTIIDADSCVKTASITLTQPTALSATASPAVVSCFLGNDGSATATGAGGALPYTYSWNTNPIQTTATASNLIAGTYTCIVTDSNSCTTNCSATVAQPTVIFIDNIPADTICAGQNSVLSALAHDGNPGGYTYTWNAPAFTGQNNTVSPNTTTTYSVIAMDSKSCLSASQTVTVKVNPLPTAGISGSTALCKNATAPNITFTGSTGTAPYTFTYTINGGANQTVSTTSGNSVTVSAPTSTVGTYTYVLVSIKDASSTACSQTQSGIATIFVRPLPIAKFGNTSVCNSTATQFNDSSTTAAGSISNWVWNLGDASPFVNTANPSRVYANAGNYTVTLIVNNSFGCGDTVTKPVQVYYNPVAGFTYSNVCYGDTMYFANISSVDNSTSIASYLWVFGDGSATNSLQNPNHYYAVAGTYTVTLVTTTIDGCSGAFIIPVKVFDAPNSTFTFNNTCLLDSAAFTNTSVSPVMGSIESWSWSFGDGSPLNTTIWSPYHLYATPGNYPITLITYSTNLGCSDTLQNTLTVFPMPVANFGFTDVCLNQPMNFNDSSTVSSGSIAGRTWNFGDGTPPNSVQNPYHIYANQGTYSVSLITVTNNGCKDTITKTVVVHPLPVAQFGTVNVCDGSIVLFADLSNIITTDTIQSWRWRFGDGTPFINNQNASHLYNNAGSYSVQLFIVSNFGCPDSITKISIVYPNPVVDFTSNDTAGCEPLCISFQNTSSIATGANALWLWNVGDGGQTSSLQSHVRCYVNDSLFSPVSFNVTLTVTSDNGCVSTLSKNNYITVYPNPNASFMVQPGTTTLTDPVISITNLSTGADFWNWNFGDQDTSSVFNPAPHTYPDTSIYTITLITSTLYNCIDTAYQTIIIEPDFIFYIPNAFTPNDDGINDFFSGKGIFTGKYEMTIFDRWGNSVFFTDDINKPWNGKVNRGTEIAQGDVYVYSINIIDFKKKKHSYKGIVTLVR